MKHTCAMSTLIRFTCAYAIGLHTNSTINWMPASTAKCDIVEGGAHSKHLNLKTQIFNGIMAKHLWDSVTLPTQNAAQCGTWLSYWVLIPPPQNTHMCTTYVQCELADSFEQCHYHVCAWVREFVICIQFLFSNWLFISFSNFKFLNRSAEFIENVDCVSFSVSLLLYHKLLMWNAIGMRIKFSGIYGMFKIKGAKMVIFWFYCINN